MLFEFDSKKSAANLKKHGIDFVDAQRLWDGRWVTLPARSDSEPRWMTVGLIGQRLWAAFWTSRYGHIRLISVRRARPKERAYYQKAFPERGSP